MTFEAIHSSYHRTIRATVSRILIDVSDIDDCVQDIFLAIWNAYESGKLPTGPTLTSYVVNTARNTAKNFRSANGRRANVISSSIDSSRPGETEPSYDSTMFADPAPLKSNPMTDGVAAAADTLPLLLREVVQLRFYSDMDVTEICEHLGVTNVVVRKRLSRAMAALKNSFAVGHKLAS